MSSSPLHPASVIASMLMPHGTGSPAPDSPEVPARRAPDPHPIRLRNHLRFSATCAILIPVVVALVTRFTDDGPARVLLTWLIALLAGAAVYASAASGSPTRRRTR